jgi:hypothetical protein
MAPAISTWTPISPAGSLTRLLGTPDAAYATVPANEMQPVTIKIKVEVYNQARGLFGFGPITLNPPY